MSFLAHILNRPVLDAAGVRLGWVEDLVLDQLDLFPRVSALVLARRGQGAVFVPWESVAQVERGYLRLADTRETLHTISLEDEAVFLRRDILDKQVVDINGRKVVRVNDLQLTPVDGSMRLIGADIGAGGLLRRLNLEGPARMVAATLRRKLPRRVIPWNYVEGLTTEWPSIQLNVSYRRLRDLPATDIADIMAQLSSDDRDNLAAHIDDATLADTLPHLEDDVQAELIMHLTEARAADIMEELPPDEAADVLGDIIDISEAHAERILHLMEPEEADDVRELLRYDDDTAGGRMTTDYLALAATLTVAQALTALRERAPDAEMVYYLYVTDTAEHLLGVLSPRDLITAAPGTPLAEITHTDVIRVHVQDDQEAVARLLNRYHLLAMPVVDDDNVLQGIVTVDDVLDVLREEAEEDESRLAGAIEEADTFATPLEQAAGRLPWVLGVGAVGLAAAVLLAVGGAQPAAVRYLLPLLALLLLPGINLGGQGAALTQVAVSEGDDLRDIVRRQLHGPWPLGLVVAFGAALLGGLFAWHFDGPTHALAVGGVLGLILLIELLVGSLLPLLLHRLRWDPVFVSRPALAALALLLGIPLLLGVL